MRGSLKQQGITFRYTLVSTVLALAVGIAGIITFTQPVATQHASAASCDRVNIVYCGLAGSTASGHISSFKKYYTSGTDGRYSDLKAVYRWAGATNSMVSGMNTSNTKVGTLYRNGDIKVDGKVVGHDSWFAARFGAGRDGFIHVTNNVWARKTTTSLAHDTYKVIVHFNQYGEADFAVAVSCGNAIKFTPVPKKPVLKCERLTFTVINRENHNYEFQARASAKNTTITSYVFRFGDGTSRTVRTSATNASTRHTYSQANKEFTAHVIVNSTRKSGVTSSACRVTVKTVAERALVCVSLTARVDANDANTYTFTANAQPTRTTITNYVFDFGDGKAQTVNTGNNTAQATHTYTEAGAEFTAKVAVNSTDFTNVSGPKCQVTVKTPEKPESPALVCESLTFMSVSNQDNTYKFTATASASNTTITSYIFNFGDGNSETVTTSEATAMATHTYSGNQDRTATVAVNSEDMQNVTSPSCKVIIPKTPVTPPEVPDEELPVTGAGDIVGFFAATTLAGAFIHRFILRKQVV